MLVTLGRPLDFSSMPIRQTEAMMSRGGSRPMTSHKQVPGNQSISTHDHNITKY